jgi:hypothetical protein
MGKIRYPPRVPGIFSHFHRPKSYVVLRRINWMLKTTYEIPEVGQHLGPINVGALINK